MDLAVRVQLAARSLPHSERFEIGSQIKRASTSIPANVAEGFSRHSRGVYRSHVAIALGSTAEVQTLLELCRRLTLLGEDVVDGLIALAREVARILYGLWRALLLPPVSYAVVLICGFLGLWRWTLGLLPEAFGLLPEAFGPWA
jgi:four helix bundle protein